MHQGLLCQVVSSKAILVGRVPSAHQCHPWLVVLATIRLEISLTLLDKVSLILPGLLCLVDNRRVVMDKVSLMLQSRLCQVVSRKVAISPTLMDRAIQPVLGLLCQRVHLLVAARLEIKASRMDKVDTKARQGLLHPTRTRMRKLGLIKVLVALPPKGLPIHNCRH